MGITGFDETKLRHAFLEEADELSQKLNECLERLEANKESPDLINEAFRFIHSLKSESALLGYSVLSELAHRMEDVFGLVRDGDLALSRAVLDRIVEGADRIAEMLSAIARCGSDSSFDTCALLSALAAAAGSPGPVAPAGRAARADSGPGAAGEFQGAADSGMGAGPSSRAPGAGQQPVEAPDIDPLRLAEARDRGERLCRLTVAVDESEVMKFPRAFLVFTNLELVANVLASSPSMEGELADDCSYARTRIYLTTTDDESRLRDAASVDQIQSVEVETLAYEDFLEAAARGRAGEAGAAPGAAPASPGTVFPPGGAAGAGSATAVAGAPTAAGAGSAGPGLQEQAPGAAQPPGESASAASAAAEPAVKPPVEKTTIRVDTRRLDDMWSLIAELIIEKSHISRVYEIVSHGGNVHDVREALGEVFDSLDKISASMQQAMMETRMVPISVIFNKFPRLVRDLSRKLGKGIELAMSGEETEIDRGIVEALSDPLTHIIRNSIDHGIEFPEERVRKGKPEKGTVRISAYQQGGNIVIELEDDGRGIGIERIREKAIAEQVPGAAEMDKERLLELIFLPGFSTRDVVTDLSGRGVGMDVVATRIRGDLKGEVKVSSEEGEGTLTTLLLPLTLTIMNALLVRSEGQLYAIPLSGVDSTAKILNTEIGGNDGKRTCRWNGEEMPLFYLGSLSGKEMRIADEYLAVVLRHGMERGCLVVDELLEEQEVVIKPIDDLLNYKRLFSGVSVQEDGTLIFILDTSFVQGGIL